MIRWYLNRVHVMTPDDEILEDFAGRIARADPPYSPLQAIGILAHALDIHHANRDEYLRLMRGQF